MSPEDMHNDEEFPILVLVDEENQEHEFELVAELEIEDENYKVLMPLEEEEDDEDEGELVILKVILDEEGNELLTDIEDDEEWEKVADAWQELIESEDI